MKKSTQNIAAKAVRAVACLIKVKMGELETVFGDGVDAGADYFINNLPSPKTVQEVLEDCKLKELRIPADHYDIVRETVEYIIKETPGLIDSDFKECAYDIKKLICMIWKHYEDEHKNDFDNVTKNSVTKGLTAYFEHIIDQLCQDHSFVQNAFVKTYKNERQLNKHEQDISKIKNILNTILHDLKQLYQDTKPQSLAGAWPDCRAWWILKGRPRQDFGLMDDRYSIQLFALLLGMTDSYNIILASIRSEGLCTRLNQILEAYRNKNSISANHFPYGYWTSFDNQFPDVLDDFLPINGGVVLNICTDNLNIVEDFVLKALELKKSKEYAFPVIFNLWSENPTQAVDVVSKIQEKWNCPIKAEFLSTISYDKLCEEKNVNSTSLQDWKNQLDHICSNYSSGNLQAERDTNPSLWWAAIQQLAASPNSVDKINGFLAARPLHSAIQRWLDFVSPVLFSEIQDTLLLQQMIPAKDWDMLYLEIFFWLKKYDERTKMSWSNVLSQIEQFCFSSDISILTNPPKDRGEQEKKEFDTYAIAVWSRYALKEEFEQMLPVVKKEPLLFWAAIINSNYGIDYILDMIADPQKQKLPSKILNQTEIFGNDTLLELDTAPIRDFVRNYEMGCNI